jgi:hypothetical protein
VGKKFGAAVWDWAAALWARLRPRLEARLAAQEAIHWDHVAFEGLFGRPVDVSNMKAKDRVTWPLLG